MPIKETIRSDIWLEKKRANYLQHCKNRFFVLQSTNGDLKQFKRDERALLTAGRFKYSLISGSFKKNIYIYQLEKRNENCSAKTSAL